MALFSDSRAEQLLTLTPMTYLIFTLLLWLAFLISSAVYNVCFHPLASFPGPVLARASNLPYIYAQIRGKLPHWTLSLHTKYDSPIIRISPSELSFIDATAWKDIYVYRPGHQPFERDVQTYGKAENGVHRLLTAPHEVHTRWRRIFDHAFSDRATREQEPIVKGYIDTLIQGLHEQIHGPAKGRVDLTKWYSWLTFDVIGDLSFGQSFGCLKTHTFHPWVQMIFGNLEGIAVMGALSRIIILRRLITLLIPKRLKQMKADHWEATVQAVNRRIESGSDRPDFMSTILRFNDEKKGGLTLPEIMANMSMFIIAGSESVATTLSGTMFYLLQNPAMMRRLSEEIETAFASEEEITPQRVSQLPYLLTCLAETGRIYPPGLSGQPMVVPPAGEWICGKWVPGGTVVSINMYAAYRSSKNFRDPHSYRPERWLDDPQFASDNRNVFQLFSVGPRSCIGKNLAFLEIRLALARTIWNFDIKLSNETDLTTWTDQKVFLTWQKKPLVVELRAKQRTEKRL